MYCAYLSTCTYCTRGSVTTTLYLYILRNYFATCASAQVLTGSVLSLLSRFFAHPSAALARFSPNLFRTTSASTIYILQIDIPCPPSPMSNFFASAMSVFIPHPSSELSSLHHSSPPLLPVTIYTPRPHAYPPTKPTSNHLLHLLSS